LKTAAASQASPRPRRCFSRRLSDVAGTAIAKELGVPLETISRWLKSGDSQICRNGSAAAESQSGISTHARYHIANCRLEHFQPPQGLTFPLIIADTPWNVSDPGHQRERTAQPRSSRSWLATSWPSVLTLTQWRLSRLTTPAEKRQGAVFLSRWRGGLPGGGETLTPGRST